MGSVALAYILQHVFVLCLVFWGLTWAAEGISTRRNHKSKAQFYECGFKSIADLNLQVNLSFTLVCAFLVLYDVEFTLLFPLLLNYHIADAGALVTFVAFLFFIIGALVYDLGHSALNTTV
jgi:NADH:ubiquinone oxidoreductase subunit 3 (subunit A)